MCLHFPTVLGAEYDIMQEAVLLIIDTPQVLHQLERMFLGYKTGWAGLVLNIHYIKTEQSHPYSFLFYSTHHVPVPSKACLKGAVSLWYSMWVASVLHLGISLLFNLFDK